jgi:hypothetical protein
MPNKTIYVKETDLPLFEQAQEQLGDSVSSLFAQFLRERVAGLTPEEHRIIELLNQIDSKREALKKDRRAPEFIDLEYAEAEQHASKSLKALRAGDIAKTKALFYAANFYYEKAERDLAETRDLGDRLESMLKRVERARDKS